MSRWSLLGLIMWLACGSSWLQAQNPEQNIAKLTSGSVEGAYAVEAGAIVLRNGPRYHNRPLYCERRPGIVLAGDRPCVRLACDPFVYGCFLAGYVRGDKAVWLHEFAERLSLFVAGRMEWRLSDPALANVHIVVEAVPLAQGAGMALRATVQGAIAGDRMVYAFGGATRRTRTDLPNLNWSLDPRGVPETQTRDFVPDDCTDNRVRIDGDLVIITPPAYDAADKIPLHTVGARCSMPGEMVITDASTFKSVLGLTKAAESKRPIACGTLKLAAGENRVCWTVEGFAGESIADRSRLDTPAASFEAGVKRAQAIGRQVVVSTPEPRLDAAVAAICQALNASWYGQVYVHGSMLWNVPFPGWRCLYGPTAYGWHDRVKAEIRYYTSHQETSDTQREPKSESSLGYGQEAGTSRFYGRGHIKQDQSFYNFQSTFFDMAVHALRWTGDAELEKLLRPALEMHLDWQRECFDPDDDGLYESYINTWPTDSVWCAGSAAGEETSFAYTGQLAAADLADRAGDGAAANRHRQRAEKIRTAFLDRFWIKDKGYTGLYIEQTGHKRLHTDSWLYSIFMPIDAGLLSPQRMVQSLYYTEWGLERVKSPLGGERCWTSNWLPATWSTRVLYPGDNYHLALAHFQAGLPEQGWNVLRGAAYEAAYNGPVPGCVATSIGGTDFTDCTSMFARTVVEGLFGYKPDYVSRASKGSGGSASAAGLVRIMPRFPAEWDHASIATPDFTLAYRRSGSSESYTVHLTKAAPIEFEVIAHCLEPSASIKGLDSVRADIVPGYNGSIVRARLTSSVQDAELVIRSKGLERPIGSIVVTGRAGAAIELRAPEGDIKEYEDPQGAMKDARIEAGALRGMASNVGHNLVFCRVATGGNWFWKIFRLDVVDPETERQAAAQSVERLPAGATWQCVDMKNAFNGDIRTIYQQQYLSPRPKTCSVRIGTDGYSPWTFYYWNKKPPVIDLGAVAGMLDKEGKLAVPVEQKSPQAEETSGPKPVAGAGQSMVPFVWSGQARNIAFTSMWDNWPRSVSVPVGRHGDAVWLLVCGTTNPMQTRIANGVIRLQYADGTVDTLELVPPINFWTLCPLNGTDYDYKTDAFCLPKQPPRSVQLGQNCRAMLLNRRLKPEVTLDRVELETLSSEVVIGLMGVTVLKEPHPRSD